MKRKILSIFIVVMILVCIMPITEVQAKKIKLNKSKVTLEVGDTAKLNVIGAKGKVKWKSSNKSIVKVNSKGKITAKKAGKAKITATNKAKKLVCKITVKSKTPITLSDNTTTLPNNTITLSIDKTALILDVGKQEAINVNVNPSSYTSSVIWNSSDENVATVINGIVTAKSVGTCAIYAKINNVTASCTVQVNQAYGNVSGNITYFYNDFKGNVSDTGSSVFLIKKDGSAKSMPDNASSYSISENKFNNYGVYATEVDGTGSYVFNNIPVGEYIMFIISKETASQWAFNGNYDSYKSGVASFLSEYISENSAKELADDVGYNKYTHTEITINANQTTNFSYDFGMTYI